MEVVVAVVLMEIKVHLLLEEAELLVKDLMVELFLVMIILQLVVVELVL